MLCFPGSKTEILDRMYTVFSISAKIPGDTCTSQRIQRSLKEWTQNAFVLQNFFLPDASN